MHVAVSTPSASVSTSAGSATGEMVCLRDSVDIAAQLRSLVGADLPVVLRGPAGAVYSTALWAEDAAMGLLVFSADARAPQVQALVAEGQAVATAQVEQVDLRFELSALRLVCGRDTCALHASFPTALERLQRRESFRVRPLDHASPVLRFTHPQQPGLDMALPVLDMSFFGLALRLPDDLPAVESGAYISGVLALDGFTELPLSLRVVRVGADGRDIGCEIAEVAPQRARTLQRYIEQTQRRRHMLTL